MNHKNGNHARAPRAQVGWGGGEMIEIKGLTKKYGNLVRWMI